PSFCELWLFLTTLLSGHGEMKSDYFEVAALRSNGNDRLTEVPGRSTLRTPVSGGYSAIRRKVASLDFGHARDGQWIGRRNRQLPVDQLQQTGGTFECGHDD